MVRTQALVCRSAGEKWVIEDIDTNLGDGDILVKMVAVGLCHTDVKAAAGKFAAKPPIVLGHEGTGYVKEVGKDVTHLKVGDAVILSFASCSTCSTCSKGLPCYCENLFALNFSGQRKDGSSVATALDGTALNGSFFGQSSTARLAVVRSQCAVKVDVPDEEDLKKLVLGCGIQTGAGVILNVCKPSDDSSVLIFGCGGVGLAAIMAAKLSSKCRIIAVDMVESKLEQAKHFGATDTINGSTEDVLARVKAMTEGKGVNYALDCVGSPAILSMAQNTLALRGTLVTVGGTPEPTALTPSTMLTRGLTYRGSHQGDSNPELMLPKLVELWRQGQFPFDGLLTFYPFASFQQALDDMESGKVVKPVLLFED